MAGLKNILIVEDDVMILELFRTTLVNAHFVVEVVSTSKDVFKKIEQFHPDCILLDVMLPGLSGLDILKELRTEPKHGCQDTYIILLTNLAQRSITESAIDSGADGYIIKSDVLPTDLPSIIASLEEV